MNKSVREHLRTSVSRDFCDSYCKHFCKNARHWSNHWLRQFFCWNTSAPSKGNVTLKVLKGVNFRWSAFNSFRWTSFVHCRCSKPLQIRVVARVNRALKKNTFFYGTGVVGTTSNPTRWQTPLWRQPFDHPFVLYSCWKGLFDLLWRQPAQVAVQNQRSSFFLWLLKGPLWFATTI